MTPAEIVKLTEHAKRAKALMAATAKANEKAPVILDNYEKALSSFVGNLQRVKDETAGLSSALAEMGNAGDVIATAFSDDKPKTTASVNAQPGENAHLADVKAQ